MTTHRISSRGDRIGFACFASRNAIRFFAQNAHARPLLAPLGEAASTGSARCPHFVGNLLSDYFLAGRVCGYL
jgi:hypothetical protein